MNESSTAAAISQALNDGDLELAERLIEQEEQEMFPDDDPMDFEITIELSEEDWFEPSTILNEWKDEHGEPEKIKGGKL